MPIYQWMFSRAFLRSEESDLEFSDTVEYYIFSMSLNTESLLGLDLRYSGVEMSVMRTSMYCSLSFSELIF